MKTKTLEEKDSKLKYGLERKSNLLVTHFIKAKEQLQRKNNQRNIAKEEQNCREKMKNEPKNYR